MNAPNFLRRAALVASFVLACISVLGAADAHAQVNRSGLARQLGSEALEAAQAGDWERAVDLFQQSYELAPRPLTLYNLASAQLEAGKLVDADENFRRFLRETAPGQNEQFRTEAAANRDALAGRIAYVTVQVEGLAEGDVVEIDAVALPAAVVGRAVPIDPGTHQIVVLRRGTTLTERSVQVDEGATVEATLSVQGATIQPVDVTPAAAAATTRASSSDVNTPPPPALSEDPDESGGVPTAVWIVGGIVLAAGLAVGAYFLFRSDDPEPFQGPNGLGVIEF